MMPLIKLWQSAGNHIQMVIAPYITLNLSSSGKLSERQEAFLSEKMLLDDEGKLTTIEKNYLDKQLSLSTQERKKEQNLRRNKQSSLNIRDYLKKCSYHPPGQKRLAFPVFTGAHWFLCIIDFNDGEQKESRIAIIDTTNIARTKLYSQIIADRYEVLIEFINKGLEANNLEKSNQNDIQYCQALQYGSAGCGITTSMNLQDAILNQEKYYPGRLSSLDQKIEYVEEKRKIRLEDRSIRRGIVHEILFRIKLAIEIQKRENQLNKLSQQPSVMPQWCNRERKKELMREIEGFPYKDKSRKPSEQDNTKEGEEIWLAIDPSITAVDKIKP